MDFSERLHRDLEQLMLQPSYRKKNLRVSINKFFDNKERVCYQIIIDNSITEEMRRKTQILNDSNYRVRLKDEYERCASCKFCKRIDGGDKFKCRANKGIILDDFNALCDNFRDL